MPTMLILRGIPTGDYPRGALKEAPALEYARRMGYTGRILDVPGNAYDGSPQMILTLQTIRENFDVAALYGFSGGGYNLRHVLDYLTDEEKKRINLVVCLGAPNNPPSLYEGPWTLVYRGDPPAGHMAGPAALLAETPEPMKPEPKPIAPPKNRAAEWIGNLLASAFSLWRKP